MEIADRVLSVRVSETLYLAVKDLARRDRRSMNAEILVIMEEYVGRTAPAAGAAALPALQGD